MKVKKKKINSDPAAHALSAKAAARLREFALEHAGALAVLTGAGISTPSGIPDYRGAEGSYSKGHEPMQHADFVRSARKRKRFWARSVRGYKYFSNRRPNLTHRGVADMERHGVLRGRCWAVDFYFDVGYEVFHNIRLDYQKRRYGFSLRL